MEALVQHGTDLAVELALLAVAAVLGAVAPRLFRLKHRGMQFALSGVSGVMIGLACFHLLPHAIEELGGKGPSWMAGVEAAMIAAVVGFCAMFLLERFLCFHHHEEPEGEEAAHDCGHGHSDARGHAHALAGSHSHAHDHAHAMAAVGAFGGLAVHGLLEGVALGAAVAAEAPSVRLAGVGTFLAIVLHKPFDSLTIAALMARAGASQGRIVGVALLLFLAIPVGVAVFAFGLSGLGDMTGLVLAGAGGMFLCIATSDLLPELQFHSHDRVGLSVALLAGIAVALGIARLEHATHDHGVHGHGAHEHGADEHGADGHATQEDEAHTSPTQARFDP